MNRQTELVRSSPKGLQLDNSQGEFLHLLLALGGGVAAALAYAVGLVLPLVWWADPRYIVPAVAAMLPPAISCVAAGLSAVFQELVAGAPRIVTFPEAGAGY